MSIIYPSFMCARRNYARCVDFWSPKGTGDWEHDTRLGKRYADEMIHWIREHKNPTIFGHIVKSMIGKGGYSGVEVGFYHRISEHLLKHRFP